MYVKTKEKHTICLKDTYLKNRDIIFDHFTVNFLINQLLVVKGQ